MTRDRAIFFAFVALFVAALTLGPGDQEANCDDDEETPSDTSTQTESDGECVCGEQGVTLTVVSGCDGWDDATACTGWASVVAENGEDPEAPFADGTEFTYPYGDNCTIRINCP
jgi:hypothetical protein